MDETSRETAAQVSTEATEWEEEPAPVLTESVRELFVSLAKAVRAHQLYEENNPVYQRFVSGLREGFRELWEAVERLPVQVEEDRMLWRGQEVYGSDRRSDSLAFLFFKDGVREIVFEPGIEDGELTRFLDVLQRARNLRPESDDLLTILWEEDLDSFRYHHVDVLVEDVELPAPGSGTDSDELRRVLEREVEEESGGTERGGAEAGTDEEEGAATAPPPAQVSAEDFNPALYSLDRNELEQLRREVEKEMNRDLRRSVLAALFDRLEEPENRERQSRILEIFRTLLPNLLSRGALRPAAAMLHELDALRRVEDLLDGPRLEEVERLLDDVSDPDTIAEVVRALEDGSIRRDSEELGTLLQFLKPAAIAPLLRAVETVDDPAVSTALGDALETLAERHRERVVELLSGHDDPVVLRGAARLAGRAGLAGAGSALAGLLDHDAAEVRLAAVEAAAELRAATAASALERALDDPERGIRIAAARALAELGYRPAAPRFREILEGGEIRRADVSEMIAFFRSYGRLRDPEAVPLLDRLLNGKGFLGRREPEDVRACAALALGEHGSPEAREALERAREQKEPVVRNAVNRALQGSESDDG